MLPPNDVFLVVKSKGTVSKQETSTYVPHTCTELQIEGQFQLRITI